MNSFFTILAGLLGLIGLALAAYYWITPAGSLPTFLPGFQAGSDHVHTTHALACLVVGLVLLAASWFAWSRRPLEHY